MRLVRVRLFEAEIRAEGEDKLDTTMSARDMPAALIAGLVTLLDL